MGRLLWRRDWDRRGLRSRGTSRLELLDARVEEVLAELAGHRDAVVAVEESDILPARDELARRGIYVEPTSAIVWPAFKQLSSQLTGPVILVMSGTGYKFQN